MQNEGVMPKEHNHGGARPNAGRKKKEPTKRMSIPLSKVDRVKAIINEK